MARVLVVAGDPHRRGLVEARLRGLGHLVLGVASVVQAPSVLGDRRAPDVAVLDVPLPAASGLDLLARLRTCPACAQVPAILLAGRVEPADVAAGHALGASYLATPVTVTALASSIAQVSQVPVHPLGSR